MEVLSPENQGPVKGDRCSLEASEYRSSHLYSRKIASDYD